MIFRTAFQRLALRFSKDISAISSLDDAVRSQIYFYVSGAGADVSRDEAARAVGVSRRVAALHLDRLAKDGWLEVSFRRLGGRSGPGAGRTSKLYRRSEKRASVSVPARNYELMTRLLTSAVQLRDVEPAAVEFGTKVGASVKPRNMNGVLENLVDSGFEPFLDAPGVVRLRNCPYHEAANETREVTCGLNLAFMQGVTAGAGLEGVTVVRENRADGCCVVFRTEAPISRGRSASPAGPPSS